MLPTVDEAENIQNDKKEGEGGRNKAKSASLLFFPL